MCAVNCTFFLILAIVVHRYACSVVIAFYHAYLLASAMLYSPEYFCTSRVNFIKFELCEGEQRDMKYT